jgi:hypothetical protein
MTDFDPFKPGQPPLPTIENALEIAKQRVLNTRMHAIEQLIAQQVVSFAEQGVPATDLELVEVLEVNLVRWFVRKRSPERIDDENGFWFSGAPDLQGE